MINMNNLPTENTLCEFFKDYLYDKSPLDQVMIWSQESTSH